MHPYEPIWIPRCYDKNIPQSMVEQYNLQPLAQSGFVYMEVRKTMYSLPQTGRLANKALVPHLAQHGYIQCEYTPGLFCHER
jgi:hypothetical protein